MHGRLSARDFSMLIALGAIVAFFTIRAPSFLGPRNLSMLVIELSITAVLALGMLLVIVPGEIDLSVGSGVGLTGGVACVLVFEHGWSSPAAMAVALVLGVVVWLGMGALIVRQKVPSFIITLGGLLIFKGLHWLVIRSATVPTVSGGATNLYSLLTTYYLPAKVGLAIVVLVVIAMAWSGGLAPPAWRPGAPGGGRRARAHEARRDRAGALLVRARHEPLSGCPADGGHPRSRGVGHLRHAAEDPVRPAPLRGGRQRGGGASSPGIAVERTVIVAFGIMGAIVALTGLLETAYAGASTTTVGSLMELDAVAACVIGGTSLRGGRGTVLGVMFGALIMATLLNGMTLLAVAPEIKFIARGAVLGLAVWVDVRLSRPR